MSPLYLASVTSGWERVSQCMAGRGQEEVPHSQSANTPGHVHSILAAAFVHKMSDEGCLQGHSVVKTD